MILYFVIAGFFFDQPAVDRAMVELRSYHETGASGSVSSPPAGTHGLSWYTQDPRISCSRDDIIIGDEPAETLYIGGYFYNYGDIIVINDGVLILDHADFNLAGNILVVHQGSVEIDSSDLRFLQSYIYQYMVLCGDSSRFLMTNSATMFNGYPFGLSIQGRADLVMDNVTNSDWTTAGVAENATATLNNVGITGEWLFADRCNATFNNVDNLLTWYFLEDSSVVDIAFPPGDTVSGFYFDSTLSTVSGIEYHVEIDASTDCKWAMIPLRGSDVIVRDSELRVTGLMFEGADSQSVAGLVNGLHYDDFTLPLTDRIYHLINTSVETWNLYPSDTSNVHVSNSIFGELCGFASSYTIIERAFCDGSGGHIEASDGSIVFVVLSSISADIITKRNGICFLGYCAVPYGTIWATGSSIMIIINSQFPEDPLPSDTSIVFVGAVSAPSSACVDDTFGIIGSAWIDQGPYQPLDYYFYRLFYRALGDSSWIILGDSNFVEVRRDTLDYWNTVGLAPGTYEVRMILKDTAGDSVEATKVIQLRPLGIEEQHDFSPHPVFTIDRMGNRMFHIAVHSALDESDIAIYDSMGRMVSMLMQQETYWQAPAGGIYFVKDNRSDRSVKLVAY